MVFILISVFWPVRALLSDGRATLSSIPVGSSLWIWFKFIMGVVAQDYTICCQLFAYIECSLSEAQRIWGFLVTAWISQEKILNLQLLLLHRRDPTSLQVAQQKKSSTSHTSSANENSLAKLASNQAQIYSWWQLRSKQESRLTALQLFQSAGRDSSSVHNKSPPSFFISRKAASAAASTAWTREKMRLRKFYKDFAK